MAGEIITTALITGFVEVLKPFVKDKRFYPILSLMLGIVFSLAINGISFKSFFTGVVYGLSASGLYSVSKKFGVYKIKSRFLLE